MADEESTTILVTDTFTDRNTDIEPYPAGHERVGYSFREWNQERNGSGVSHVVGSKYRFPANTTLYAQWDPIEYAIQYNMNGIGSIPSDSLFNYTIEDRYVPPSPVEVEGYSFVGWTPSEIVPGTTGPVTFNANWEDISGRQITISYNKNLSVASLPSNRKTKYVQEDIETQDYTPPTMANPANTTQVDANTFGYNDYMQGQVLGYVAKGWSPDKLYSGHVGDMCFDGDWLKRYTSYLCLSSSAYASSYRLGNRWIFVKIPQANYTLTFGDDQYIYFNHDGDKTNHGVALYLSVYMVKGNDLLHLANIPIPPDCAYLQDSNGKYTKKVSSLTSSFWGNTWVSTTGVKNGTVSLTLKQQTLYYGFYNGNSQSPLVQIRDVPVNIPVPGSTIPSSIL